MQKLTFNIEVNSDKAINQLRPIIDKIDELKELSINPDKAERIADEIYRELYKTISCGKQ